MGIAHEGGSTKQQTSTLARLRIHHTPIMGEAEVNGKRVNMEVIEGGHYKLEIPDGPTYYAKDIAVRPIHATLHVQEVCDGLWEHPQTVTSRPLWLITLTLT